MKQSTIPALESNAGQSVVWFCATGSSRQRADFETWGAMNNPAAQIGKN